MRYLTAALFAVAVAACGDSTSPEDSFLTMTVDGAPFTAVSPTLVIAGPVLFVTGTDPGTDTEVMLAFDNLGPGTYEVGTSSTTAITYTVGTDEWEAAFGSGGAGSVNVSRVTSIRVAGSFAGQLVAQSGQTPDTVSVTNGAFEIVYE
jgi:hypothetical protein